MALEVIGAGFGRTGTLSLKKALEKLGFRKCHHMEEVLPSSDQVAFWQGLADGAAPDWDAAFDGFRASCDWPSCDHFEALMHHYPQAKVVLTVRDEQRWYDSVNATIWPFSEAIPAWIGLVSPHMKKFNDMVYAAIWNKTFDGRFEDREFAISVYRDHIARVKDVVPPDRLLVFEVKDGWQPLCAFLDVPVPEGDFPHLNDSATQAKRLRVVKFLTRGIPVAAVGTLAALAWWFFA